jgi:hypothetical protein
LLVETPKSTTQWPILAAIARGQKTTDEKDDDDLARGDIKQEQKSEVHCFSRMQISARQREDAAARS